MVSSEDAGVYVGPTEAPDKYLLIKSRGHGAEGEVWQAALRLSEGGVSERAVKIMKGTASAQQEESWLAHGRILESLTHAGIVRVHEAFLGAPPHRREQLPPRDGTVTQLLEDAPLVRYVVMTYAKGEPLSSWLGDRPQLSLYERLQMLRTTASALDYIHVGTATKVPVIHGDVKPGNIHVVDGEATLLVDWGLARIDDEVGKGGFTRAYASPQARRTGRTSVAADRYAFAATVAHGLTGQPPPEDAAGQALDLAALRSSLDRSPVVGGRSALIDGVSAALAPEEADRPQEPLSAWLSGLVDTLSSTTLPSEAEAKDTANSAATGGQFDGQRQQSTLRGRGRPVLLLLGVLGAAVAVLFAGSVQELLSAREKASADGGEQPLKELTEPPGEVVQQSPSPPSSTSTPTLAEPAPEPAAPSLVTPSTSTQAASVAVATLPYSTLCGRGGVFCASGTGEFGSTLFGYDHWDNAATFPDFGTLSTFKDASCQAIDLRFIGWNHAPDDVASNIVYLRVIQAGRDPITQEAAMGQVARLSAPLSGGSFSVQMATKYSSKNYKATWEPDKVYVTGTADCRV